MTKKISSSTTTTSRVATRAAPQEESAKGLSNSAATPTTPTADAPGVAPASAPAAPSPGATTPSTAPTSLPQALTAETGAGAEAGAGGAAGDEKKSNTSQVVTRFPAELAARLDRFLESLRGERFGLRVSRADAVRILVHQALAAHERGTVERSRP